ncbi:MAG: ribosome biogenesis GTPase Der [Caldicoprobacterales bacterium]|jgi:GTP-binding protein|nr:ribosome biogenesis GTPase Der [Clostridiales bacterium]
MTNPIVAIVGRPNVGKSTLFNQLVGQRISIVDDQPGVTRDRIYADTEWLGRKITLVDTGGIDVESQDELMVQMKQQANVAIETSEAVIFLVDGKEGITPADQEVANLLRIANKPVILGVNKIDAPHEEDMIYEFYNLGIGDPISISASHKRGLGDLLDAVIEHLPQHEMQEEEDDVIKIAVLGKPNVGKSSIVNKLLGEERVIVSNIPGTTRDAIDTPFEVDGQKYIIIDTAGIRRKSRINEELERYSVIRALAAIRRCDVALLVIDATEGVTEQDARIAGLIHDEGKGCIVIMNKWDLVEKDTNTMNQYRKQLMNDLAFMQYAPSLFTSAHTGQRLNRIIEMVNEVYVHCTFRISTGVLNDCIADAVTFTEPPTDKGRRLKIYYGTQVAVKPPTFVLFVNDPDLMHYSYLRYLENQFRKSFGLEGTPIRFILRERKSN